MRQMTAVFEEQKCIETVEKTRIDFFQSSRKPSAVGGTGDSQDDKDEPGEQSKTGNADEECDRHGCAGDPTTEDRKGKEQGRERNENSEDGGAFEKAKPFPAELRPVQI